MKYFCRSLVHGDEDSLESFIVTFVGAHRAMFVLNNLYNTQRRLVDSKALNLSQPLSSAEGEKEAVLTRWIPTAYGEGDYYGIFQSKVEEGEGEPLPSDSELIGVVAHYWNNNIVIHFPHEKFNVAQDVITELMGDIYGLLRACGRPIQGILGHDEDALPLLQLFEQRVPDIASKWATNTRDYFMEAVVDASILSWKNPYGMSDACEHYHHKLPSEIPSEIFSREQLLEWIIDFERTAMCIESPNLPWINSRLDNWYAYSTATGPVSTSNDPASKPRAWILLNETETPVCIVGISCRIDGVIQIGPVYTPPQHRKRGYARHLMAKALQEEWKHQWSTRAVLMAEDPTAIRCYKDVGFAVSGGYRLALLQSPVHI